MSSSAMLATDNTVTQNDANIYDNTEYYSNIYDEAAYDDYQLYSSPSHYNKVRHSLYKNIYHNID